MKTPEDGWLRRVFIGEADAWHGHTLRPPEHPPVVIEMVDSNEKIDSLLPHADARVGDGLVTPEQVRVITYRANPPA
jgi:PII-like signaling protein